MSAIPDLLVSCGAVRFGDFVLASGARSNYYVDIKKASTRPDVLRAIGAAIGPRARGYDFIAGMELGAVPIAVAASLSSGVPFLIVRKRVKEHGTGKRIEGDPRAGARVLLVEDVTTSGGSSHEALVALREAGLVVDRIVTVVDREAGARERFEKEGLAFEALATASELLEGRR